MTDAIHSAIDSARQARTAGRVDEASRGYARAVELARAARENLLLAHALRHVSDIARERGFPAPALAAGQEAVAIYRIETNASPLDLANALRVTALALKAQGRPLEAMPLWREARHLYARIGVDEGIYECDINIGGVLGER